MPRHREPLHECISGILIAARRRAILLDLTHLNYAVQPPARTRHPPSENLRPTRKLLPMIPSIPRPLVMLLAALGIPTVALAQAVSAPAAAQDPIAQLVARLDLEQYKATIKGLTQFGDRRQGTDRNRAAVDWIEAQLKRYGCSDVARLKYEYQPPSPPSPEGRGGQGVRPAVGGGRYRGIRAHTGVNTDSLRQPDR